MARLKVTSLKIAVIATTITFTHLAVGADEYVGGRKIVDMGCQHLNGTCFIQLDGPLFGSTMGCPNPSTVEFRFDDGDTVNGRRTYASLLAAFLANRTVSVLLQGCSVQGYPKLSYFHILAQ